MKLIQSSYASWIKYPTNTIDYLGQYLVTEIVQYLQKKRIRIAYLILSTFTIRTLMCLDSHFIWPIGSAPGPILLPQILGLFIISCNTQVDPRRPSYDQMVLIIQCNSNWGKVKWPELKWRVREQKSDTSQGA